MYGSSFVFYFISNKTISKVFENFLKEFFLNLNKTFTHVLSPINMKHGLTFTQDNLKL